MKIDISAIDRTNFMVHPHDVAGETCWLVQPVHIGAKWNRDNLIFRSSVWNSRGELISASHKKFFNAGEQPDLYPNWENAKDGYSVEKIDGSALILSKYKGTLIARTRGTTDASRLDNGFEIEYLKNKYPVVFNNDLLNSEKVSIILEWYSPNNIIVLRYGDDPRLFLTGIINHEDYSLVSQRDLNDYSVAWQVSRPEIFKFNTLKEMVDTVTAFKDKEGVCYYFNNNQNIVKLKGSHYLKCHKLKSEIGSLDKIIDLFFEVNHNASYNEFYSYIETTFDFELATQCRGYISIIVDGMKEVRKIESAMRSFAEPLKTLSRKEAALKILSSYSITNRSSMVFTLLDGKGLTKDQLMKLLYQVIKK